MAVADAAVPPQVGELRRAHGPPEQRGLRGIRTNSPMRAPSAPTTAASVAATGREGGRRSLARTRKGHEIDYKTF